MLKKRFFKTKEDCEVTFELAAETAGKDAATVELLCEANGWQPILMKKVKKCGSFRTRIRLPKQREYEFLYRVDRQAWINDDSADGYRSNGFGGQNSVLSTAPAS